jgi:nucleotide sugar dehydrogenase
MPVCVLGCSRVAVTMATQYALKGLLTGVTGIDVRAIDRIAAGDLAFADEPELVSRLASARGSASLVVTSDLEAAARAARTIVIFEPVVLDAAGRADYSALDETLRRAGAAMSPGVLVIYEGIVAVGDMRERVLPALERASGRGAGAGFSLAYAVQRTGRGHVLADSLRSPKIVAALDTQSRDRAAELYGRTMDTFLLFTETFEDAELVNLMETAARDVYAAYANDVAALAQTRGIDVRRVIAMANAQPYSWTASAGLEAAPEEAILASTLLRDAHRSRMAAVARAVNEDVHSDLLRRLDGALGGLTGRCVVILPPPHAVHESERSLRATHDALRARGAVAALAMPDADGSEIRMRAEALWISSDRAIIADLDLQSWPALRAVVDTKNVLSRPRIEALGLRYIGVGR